MFFLQDTHQQKLLTIPWVDPSQILLIPRDVFLPVLQRYTHRNSEGHNPFAISCRLGSSLLNILHLASIGFIPAINHQEEEQMPKQTQLTPDDLMDELEAAKSSYEQARGSWITDAQPKRELLKLMSKSGFLTPEQQDRAKTLIRKPRTEKRTRTQED